MSQNSHTLLLFFDNLENYKSCFKLFKALELGKEDKALEVSDSLGVDVSSTWNDDWFNQSVSANSKFIRLDYDSSTSYYAPLEVLESLFNIDLRVACLEVFNDQVGEFVQYFFKDGMQVDRAYLYSKNSKIEKIVTKEFECAFEDLDEYEHEVEHTSIADLMVEQEAQQVDAEEMVASIKELSKVMRETGKSPEDILRGAMLITELKSALIKGMCFGVITVLLFKGMWFWIILSILLTALLIIYGILKVSHEFDEDDEESDELSNSKGEE